MTTTEETLGTEFWTQPIDVLDDLHNLMYAQTIQVLREEVRERGGSGLDYMLVERLGFMYAYLRQREAGSDITDRNRREMLKDWLELATSMKKLWTAEDKDNQAESLLKKVNSAVIEAVKGMPGNQSVEVQRALMEAFAEKGL